MATRPTRPDREAAAKKRQKYCSTGEASRLLGGVIAPGVLRAMCLAGEVKGSILVRERVYLPRYIVPSLVKDLEYQAVRAPKVIHRNTFDAQRAG